MEYHSYEFTDYGSFTLYYFETSSTRMLVAWNTESRPQICMRSDVANPESTPRNFITSPSIRNFVVSTLEFFATISWKLVERAPGNILLGTLWELQITCWGNYLNSVADTSETLTDYHNWTKYEKLWKYIAGRQKKIYIFWSDPGVGLSLPSVPPPLRRGAAMCFGDTHNPFWGTRNTFWGYPQRVFEAPVRSQCWVTVWDG